jgi:hypothetical protein
MMVRNSLTFLVSISLLILWSCQSDDEMSTPTSGNEVQLRIENVSTFTFDEVYIEAGGGGDQTYDDISSGALSDYKVFDYVYRYGFIQVLIADDTLSLQPIDYVGEERYTSGQFTYVIDIISELEQPAYMILEFREE